MVEQEGYGVREDFAQHSACQMPQIARPHPLYAVALHKLREDGIYAVAKPAQQSAFLRSRISLLGGVRSHKLYAHRAQELFLCLGRVIVAIPDHDAAGTFDDLGQHRELMSVGRSHREVRDETGPRHSHMHPEAVEGLPKKCVLAESGLSTKTATAVGASEEARWQGQRVADGEGGVMRGEAEKLLPEAFLELPEVSTLSGEVGAVDLAEGRGPFAVVKAEVAVKSTVGVYAEELTYDLYGEW